MAGSGDDPTAVGDDVPPAAVPEPMLTVAAVARRLGVAPSTLRTWDRRYGLGPSAHTAGAHRRYSNADLTRLVHMRRLTMQGVPPADAAQIARAVDVVDPVADGLRPGDAAPSAGDGRAGPPASSPPPLSSVPPPASADPWEPDDEDPPPGIDWLGRTGGSAHAPARPAREQPSPVTLFGLPVGPLGIPAARDHRYQRGAGTLDADSSRALSGRGGPGWATRRGGGRVVALPSGSPQARGLARAAMALDTIDVNRIVEDAFAAYGVVRTWEELIRPVLHALGERWSATGEGVEVEHIFAEAVLGSLRGVTARLRRPRNARPVLLTCAEGDYHTLPLHVLGAALAEEGIDTLMLGLGLPPEGLVAAVRRIGPGAVFVFARLPVEGAQVLAELPRQRPAPRLVVGGEGWGCDVPAGVERVTSLPDAVTALHRAVLL